MIERHYGRYMHGDESQLALLGHTLARRQGGVADGSGGEGRRCNLR
jgi:hypothetical protein